MELFQKDQKEFKNKKSGLSRTCPEIPWFIWGPISSNSNFLEQVRNRSGRSGILKENAGQIRICSMIAVDTSLGYYVYNGVNQIG